MQNMTERTQIRRGARRACSDPAVIEDILRSNFLCHVSFVLDGQARVMPTAYVYHDGAIYLHGNIHNGMLRALLDGQTASLAVTEVNGLVLARSGMHHSVNYRSVMIFAEAMAVADEDKVAVLDALIDNMVPGRAASLRPYLQKELDATLVLRLPLDELSCKLRSGPPVDAEADYACNIWAGVLSLKTVVSDVQSCPRLAPHIGKPAHLQRFLAERGSANAGREQALDVS